MTGSCQNSWPDQSNWTFTGTSNGYAKITTGPTNGVRAWTATANGTTIGTTVNATSPAQDWMVTVSGTGYNFESRARPGYCADQTGAATMGLAACNASDLSQRFTATVR